MFNFKPELIICGVNEPIYSIQQTFDRMLTDALRLYLSKLPTLPALPFITGTYRTANREPGNKPGTIKHVKHIPRRDGDTMLAYLTCSAQI